MRLMLFRLFMLFCLGLSACSPRRENGGGGVVDGGGGGDFAVNSREEVTTAVKATWKLLIDLGPANPFLLAYAKSEKSREQDEVEAHRILAKILEGPAPIPDIPEYSKSIFGANTDTSKFEISNLKYLHEIKPELSETLCSGPHDQRFMASVTHLTRTARLCVSLKALMQAPAGALHRDLLALLFHEVAHMNGFDEKDARKLQRYALVNIDHLLRTGLAQRNQELVLEILELMTIAPLLISYDKITDIQLRRIQEFQRRIHRYVVPHPHLGLNVQSVDLKLFEELISRRNTITGHIEKYGELLGEALDRDPQARMTPENLLEARKLMNELAEFVQLTLYYLGKSKVRPSKNQPNGFSELIESVTDAKNLEPGHSGDLDTLEGCTEYWKFNLTRYGRAANPLVYLDNPKCRPNIHGEKATR